jgi:AhpD family alkylhydroperoxidase
MTRIPMVEPADEPVEIKPVFDQLRRTRGRVPGMYRTLAQQPAVLAAHRAYFHAALDTGVLPRPFKEKIAFKVARLRRSPYCTGSHRSYALNHGVSAAELDAIDRSDYRALDGSEAAALEFTEAMVQERGAVDASIVEKFGAHYSASEIVEIAALVAIMDLACTLASTFGLDPD